MNPSSKSGIPQVRHKQSPRLTRWSREILSAVHWLDLLDHIQVEIDRDLPYSRESQSEEAFEQKVQLDQQTRVRSLNPQPTRVQHVPDFAEAHRDALSESHRRIFEQIIFRLGQSVHRETSTTSERNQESHAVIKSRSEIIILHSERKVRRAQTLASKAFCYLR